MVRPLFFIVLSLALKSASRYELSLPDCPQTCGNMTVPYPFGTKEGCYLKDQLFINCTTITTDDHNPKAFISTTNIEVTDINLSSGELRSWMFFAHQCFNSSGTLSINESNRRTLFYTRHFRVSHLKNKFAVVGCDTYAYFYFQDNKGVNFSTGCMRTCDILGDVNNGMCAGSGCCQLPVPKRARGVRISLRMLDRCALLHKLSLEDFELA